MEPPSYEESLTHSPYIGGASDTSYAQPPSLPYPGRAPQGLVCPPPLTVTNNQPSSSGAQAQTPSTDPEAADFEVVSFNPVAGVTIGDSSPYFYPSVAPTAPPAPANYGPQAEPKATSNGYQQTSSSCFPPAAYALPPFDKSYYMNIITEEQILNSFDEHVKKKSWFFNRPKNPRRFVSIKSFIVDFRLRYKLSTYVESRSFVTKTEKVYGRKMPQVANCQPSSDLWSYDLKPDSEFWKGNKEKVIQHTVEKCDKCFGLMRKKCFACDTSGKVTCFPHNVQGTCVRCNGSNLITCVHCQGMGSVKCDKCDGNGAMRLIKSVVAQYEVKEGFHFEGEKVEVPQKKLEGVSGGVNMYTYESPPPIQPLPPYSGSTTMNESAMNLLREHYDKFVQASRESARVLKQKQSLIAIPVTTVELVYRGKHYKLWIYGTEMSIHCPAMDACSIL